MNAYEYMNSVLDMTLDIEFTEEELDMIDMIDFTISSIILQLNWQDIVKMA